MPFSPDLQELLIPVDGLEENAHVKGCLAIPSGAKGIVIFAHGSGSGRNSSRNQYVARMLNDAGFAVALFDLLTESEIEKDERAKKIRFDIDLLSARLISITDWIMQNKSTKHLAVGYFGASTGAAAAIFAANHFRGSVKALVSRGGRVDLARAVFYKLPHDLPILFLVGSNDPQTIKWNQDALKGMKQMQNNRFVMVPGASHLFEEQGPLEEVAKYAASWFETYLDVRGA